MVPAWSPATRALLTTGAMPRAARDRGPCLAVQILRNADAYLATGCDAARERLIGWTRLDARGYAGWVALSTWPFADGHAYETHGRVHVWCTGGWRTGCPRMWLSVDRRIVAELVGSHQSLRVYSRAEREASRRALLVTQRAAAAAYEQRVTAVLATLRAGGEARYADGQEGGRLSVDDGASWVSRPRIERELAYAGESFGEVEWYEHRTFVSLDRHRREYHSTWRWREERETEASLLPGQLR